MPAVAGGDQHGVDVLAVEQFAEVAESGAVLVAVMLVHEFLAQLAPALQPALPVQPARLHVTDRQALHVGMLEHSGEVVGATRANADHAQSDALRCGRPSGPPSAAAGTNNGAASAALADARSICRRVR